jgi:hypothetical protein
MAQPDYIPDPPTPPELATALAEAQARLYRWTEARAALARLNRPNQVAVAQVNSEIIVAQAAVDAARDDIAQALPAPKTLPHGPALVE